MNELYVLCVLRVRVCLLLFSVKTTGGWKVKLIYRYDITYLFSLISLILLVRIIWCK